MTVTGERSVAIITPWYPTPRVPFGGAFVQELVKAVAPRCDSVTVYHCDLWGLPKDLERAEVARRSQRRLQPLARTAVRGVAGATVHYVPALLPNGSDWETQARAHAEWLTASLRGEPIPAPVVHAHVGIRGAYAALENARPDAKVYVTEHASFLDQVLAEPGARDLYDEVIDRATRFFAVGRNLVDQLGAVYPHHRAKLEIVANPIDFGAARREPPRRIRRWITIGALTPRKRIDYLLRAFAECRADDPDLRLTIVGRGNQEPELRALATELGLDDAVVWRGAVDPADIPAVLAGHDLFVHASRHETFGVVVVEALAAGVPALVSRCGGPEELLEGIEADAGAMYDVDESPAALVKAYRELTRRVEAGLDLDRAREHLRRRYSREAVADHHERIWFGPSEGAPQ
ncbi:glycosyltransferase [Glycomyces sp. NPDC046736]|uniref:glycosyltransferase n=1 Tax=Glycomyces sp. NPDC046736 TaxID=3155615 RepID=UPI0033F61654